MSKSYTAVVRQAIDLLEGMHVKEYQQQLPPNFPSSIGAHIRHVIDHFLALMASTNSGHIDYNKRHRHNNVEQFPDKAIAEFEVITNWLANIDSNTLNNTVLVTSEIDVSHEHSATCESTLERELMFASSHAIHHYAIIRIMCNMQNKHIPKFFGYAPATITHINKTA